MSMSPLGMPGQPREPLYKFNPRSGGDPDPVHGPKQREPWNTEQSRELGSNAVYVKDFVNEAGESSSAVYIKGNVPPYQALMSHLAGLVFGSDSFKFDPDKGKIRFVNEKGDYDKELHEQKMGVLSSLVKEVRTPNVQLDEHGVMVGYKEKREGQGRDVIDVEYHDGKMVLKSDTLYSFEIDTDKLKSMEADPKSNYSKFRKELEQKYPDDQLPKLSDTLKSTVNVFETFYTTQVVPEKLGTFRLPKHKEIGSLHDPATIKKQMELHLLAKKTRRQAVKTIVKRDLGLESKKNLDAKISKNLRKMTVVQYKKTFHTKFGDAGEPPAEFMQMLAPGRVKVIGPAYYLSGDDPKLQKSRMRQQIKSVDGYITSKKINPKKDFDQMQPQITVGRKTKMQAERAVLRGPNGLQYNVDDYATEKNLRALQGVPPDQAAQAATSLSVDGALTLCDQLMEAAENNLNPTEEIDFFAGKPLDQVQDLCQLRDIDLLLADIAENRLKYSSIEQMRKKITNLEAELAEITPLHPHEVDEYKQREKQLKADLKENTRLHLQGKPVKFKPENLQKELVLVQKRLNSKYHANRRAQVINEIKGLKRDVAYFSDRLLLLSQLVASAEQNPRLQPDMNLGLLLEDINSKKIFKPGGVKVGDYIMGLQAPLLESLHNQHREIYMNQADAKKMIEQALVINAQNEGSVKVLTQKVGIGVYTKGQARVKMNRIKVQRQKLNDLLARAPKNYRGMSPAQSLQYHINRGLQGPFAQFLPEDLNDVDDTDSDDFSMSEEEESWSDTLDSVDITDIGDFSLPPSTRPRADSVDVPLYGSWDDSDDSESV